MTVAVRENNFKGYLCGRLKKPGRKPIPRELVLSLWAEGKTGPEIQNAVRRSTGQVYTVPSIYQVIRFANEEGDPRARRRVTGTPRK